MTRDELLQDTRKRLEQCKADSLHAHRDYSCPVAEHLGEVLPAFMTSLEITIKAIELGGNFSEVFYALSARHEKIDWLVFAHYEAELLRGADDI